MRVLALSLCLVMLGIVGASAQTPITREDIVVTGGPALRYLEHGKAASHDVYWFNFVDASVIWLKNLKADAKPNELVTWLIFRPGYASRSQELGLDLIELIKVKAKKLGVNLLWFDTKEQLINYLNQGQDRGKVKISSFNYFGHSNKACFLFDYSNTVDTMSVVWLHVRDLKKIKDNIFADDAVCKSWGCHSGEQYSQWWKSRFDVPMTGAIGKTDFAHGGLPMLSNSEGKWVQ